MRHKIVAGNWKMHKNAAETTTFLNDLVNNMPSGKEVEVMVAPAFTNLMLATQILEDTNITVAAQNMIRQKAALLQAKFRQICLPVSMCKP